ncbi:MAG TPA: hypothetical protein VNN19_05025 [bacterium]|nr:hypothetical protein [bacterium]
MIRDDDFTKQLETYLDEYEGMTPLPDDIRDSVRAAIPHTKQAAPDTGPSRYLRMTLNVPPVARYGLAAAAVIAAVLVGASMFAGGLFDTLGGGPSRQPGASPSAFATPRAGATSLLQAEEDADGNLPAGDYYVDDPDLPGRIDFQLPSGWWYYYDGPRPDDSATHAVLVNSFDSGAANGSAWGLAFTTVSRIRVDPCDPAEKVDGPATVDGLVEAFSAWSEFPVTTVEDIMVSGFPAKRVEITRAETISCRVPSLFETPSGYRFEPQFASTEPLVNQFTFVEVGGSVLTIWTTDYPGRNDFEVSGGASPDPQAHVQDQVELHEILDSILIQPR